MFFNCTKMKEIWIVCLSKELKKYTDDQLLKYLPDSIVNRALRYLDRGDFLSFVTGRLLLRKAILASEYSKFSIEDITYSENGKPSIDGFNFSISHSNGYVVLVFGANIQIGIDIEKRKDVDLKFFKYLFTDLEWNNIIQNKIPLDKFYWYWVRKEALLKAVGCSLKELKELEVYDNYGIYKGQKYYLNPFTFDTEFNGMIAVDKEVDFTCKYITLEALLR